MRSIPLDPGQRPVLGLGVKRSISPHSDPATDYALHLRPETSRAALSERSAQPRWPGSRFIAPLCPKSSRRVLPQSPAGFNLSGRDLQTAMARYNSNATIRRSPFVAVRSNIHAIACLCICFVSSSSLDVPSWSGPHANPFFARHSLHPGSI
jgi:hypothetical protein